VRKLTLSVVSITSLLVLSALFSTAQAFILGGSDTTCGGYLTSVSATGGSVEIGVACLCKE